MASIAIVGTEACGKTVFITTLAMKLAVMNKAGVFLQPKDARTLKYVTDNWRALNNREWPPFTRQGELFELQWIFKTGKGQQFDVRLVDAAGHDLRQLFAEGLSDAAHAPDALKPLAYYCSLADIILFMVNLKDFIGTADEQRQVENQQALLWAMDFLKKAGKVCCILFTQADQYADYVQEQGGWNEVARTKLNWVYGAHLADGSVEFLTVAAVKETEVIIDNGVPRMVPRPGFTSDGLESVINWVVAKGSANVTPPQRAAAPPSPKSSGMPPLNTSVPKASIKTAGKPQTRNNRFQLPAPPIKEKRPGDITVALAVILLALPFVLVALYMLGKALSH